MTLASGLNLGRLVVSLLVSAARIPIGVSLSKKKYDTSPQPPKGRMTRGQFVVAWWDRIKQLSEMPFR